MARILLGKDLAGAAVYMDLDRLVESRLLVQANSGGGKSYLLRRLLEQSHGKVQQLVLDIEGEFHTLREKYDYVLAARAGGDTLADPRSAGLLARRLLELGVSAILDLYELKAAERTRFVRLFLEALVAAPRELWHPVLVIVDEAHHFCPQKGEAESAAAVIDLMTRGRKRGFCGVLATQRLSKLHKDAAAEANVKLIGRASLDVDMQRASEELGVTTKEERARLRGLPAGRFFAFGPGLSDSIIEVQVGEVETTHPRPGQRAAPVPPARGKVKEVLARLADLPQEAAEEAKTTAELRTQVAALNRQLAARPAPPAPPAAARVEVPVLKEEHLASLHEAVEAFGDCASAVRDDSKALVEVAAGLERLGRDIIAAVSRASRGRPPAGMAPLPAAPAARRPSPLAPSRPSDALREAEGVTPARQRILDALAYLRSVGVEAADRVQLSIFAKASPKSSAYANNLGGLRSGGLIEYDGAGRVALTAAGEGAAQTPDRPPTVEELHASLRSRLQPARWRILESLIGVYPDGLVRGALADVAGASATSSAFANNLGGLRSLGLIDYRGGEVVALPVLFLSA